MKTLDFIRENNDLILVYTPEAFYNGGLLGKYTEEGKIPPIKRCFRVTKEDEYSFNDDGVYDAEESIAFKIGEMVGDYFRIKKVILGTNHDFYFHIDIKFNDKLFIADRNINILGKIDAIAKRDIYIGGNHESAIPISVYSELIKKFPTTYELSLYAHKRVAQVLMNYFDGLGEYTDKYEKFLNRKLDFTQSQHFHYENEVKLLVLKAIHARIVSMLEEEKGFSEEQWQEIVKGILLFIYPKYILAEREITIGKDARHKKRPDFLLIDSSGFVDILEIKKPNDQRVITKTEYRDNYVADRDLSGAIVQIEKYVQCLNRSGESGEEKLQKLLSPKIPEGLTVKIVNPIGILLMGRSNDLNEEQRRDLEVIKRQHKNIVDIMAYDDLVDRLSNMIKQLEMQT